MAAAPSALCINDEGARVTAADGSVAVQRLRSLPELRGLSAGVVGVVAALCGVLLLLVLLRALYKLQRADGGGGTP